MAAGAVGNLFPNRPITGNEVRDVLIAVAQIQVFWTHAPTVVTVVKHPESTVKHAEVDLRTQPMSVDYSATTSKVQLPVSARSDAGGPLPTVTRRVDVPPEALDDGASGAH
jgi:hypothetical protein